MVTRGPRRLRCAPVDSPCGCRTIWALVVTVLTGWQLGGGGFLGGVQTVQGTPVTRALVALYQATQPWVPTAPQWSSFYSAAVVNEAVDVCTYQAEGVICVAGVLK